MPWSSQPTSPSPGPGYTWNTALGAWVKGPNAGALPGATNPSEPAPAGATDPDTGLTQGAGGGKPVAPYVGAPNLNDFGTPGGALENAQSGAGQTLSDLKDQAGNPQTRDAPQAGAPPVVGATSVGVTKPVAAQAAAPSMIAGPTIGGTTVGPAQQVEAPGINQTPGAIAATATAASVDQAQQAQVRQRQLALLGQLEGTAAGTSGPSVAELQGQKQAQDAVSQQLGLVSMNHGRGAGGALRTAGMNVAKIQSDAAANAAILRAQEQTAARSQLLSGYEGTRGADIGLATTEAGFKQQAGLQNASQATSVSQSNAAQEAARSMKDAELLLSARQGNQVAVNEMNRRQAELEAQRKSTEAGLQTEVAKANQATSTQVNLANTANEQQANVVGATEANKVNMSDAENQLRAGLANADNATKTALANAGFTLEGRRIDDAKNIAAVQSMLDAQRQFLQSADQIEKNRLARASLDEAIRAGDRDAILKIVGSVVSAGGAVGAAALAPAALSDRRAKTKIMDLYSDERGKKDQRSLLDSYDGKGKDEVGEMLDRLHPVKFEYKNPAAEGAAPGQRYGVIAQDLEKSPMGRSIVVDMPDGHKGIDTAQAVGVLLAAMARMRQSGKRKVA